MELPLMQHDTCEFAQARPLLGSFVLNYKRRRQFQAPRTRARLAALGEEKMEGKAQEADGAMKITAEEVIAKLKDDGDFDTLRLRLIRKLKENEDLRNSIISAVKQSTALNHPGADNLKPRELSDTIHQEIGGKVMGQISDAVWAVIRSEDGMKKEITETVQSVYDKLAYPQGKDVLDGLSATPDVSNKDANDPLSISTSDDNPSIVVTASEQNPPSKSALTEQPLLSPRNHDPAGDLQEAKHKELIPEHQPSEGAIIESRNAPDASEVSKDQPPDIAVTSGEHKHRDDASDEDPDVPPGFG